MKRLKDIRLNFYWAFWPKLKIAQHFFNKCQLHLKNFLQRVLLWGLIFCKTAWKKHDKFKYCFHEKWVPLVCQVLISFEDQNQKMENVRVTTFQFLEDKVLSIIWAYISQDFEQLNEEILGFLSKMSCITFVYFLQNVKDTV